MAEVIRVVMQPVGRTPGVLEAPLDKYKPRIVVLFTSQQSYADVTIDHIQHSWIEHIGGMPKIIVKIVEEPWTKDAVDRYMNAFDEAVQEIESEFKHEEISWHVGTAGGTNLMAIASALSAFTHRFSVYSTLDSAHYPKVKKVSKLAIEIDLFNNLGPGFKALQSKRGMKFMKFIARNAPVQNDAIIKFDGTTKQNVSAGLGPLKKANLILKTGLGWVATNVGKSLLALMDYEEE